MLYQKPTLEILKFETEDVIRTSDPVSGNSNASGSWTGTN